MEILVVDQSDDDTSARRLREAFGEDPRLTVIRSDRRGKGAGLNEGLASARGEILVCTDDDCEASPTWPIEMSGALMQRPDVGVMFCKVLPGEVADQGEGYIPAYLPRESRETKTARFGVRRFGLGAGMAVRADVVRSLGGFDEAFGPGGVFPSCDDTDIALRLLLLGWHVYEAADIAVVHHGFRTLSEGRKHARRDWIALGAVCAKPLRAGYWQTATLAAWVFFVDAVWPPWGDLLRLRRPRGLTRIVSFVEGFWRGLRTPVDHRSMKFIKEPRQPPERRTRDAGSS